MISAASGVARPRYAASGDSNGYYALAARFSGTCIFERSRNPWLTLLLPRRSRISGIKLQN